MTPSTTPRWRNLRIGMFFIVGLTIFMTALFIVGTNRNIFRRMTDYRIVMDNAQGLSEGGLVSLSGLQVGRITGIEFIEKDGLPSVEIRFAMQRRYRHLITGSSVATLRTVGVLGDKFIDLSLGRTGEPPLAEGSELPVRGTIDWAATFEKGVNALDDFLALIKETSATMAKVNEGEGTLGLLVSDPETRDRFRGLVANADAVARALRDGDGTMAGLINRPDALDKLNRVLDRMDALAQQATEGDGLAAKLLSDPAMVARVDSLISDSGALVASIGRGGTTGRLITDETLYQDFRSTLEELRALVADMKENPGRYVRVSIF